MATHTDTAGLKTYQASSYPNIEGGEQRFITKELQRISAAISQLVIAAQKLEARMNTNGLT
jgi:hypothetical protein